MTEESRARSLLVADLAIARAEVYEELVGLNEADFALTLPESEWTAKDLIGHISAWDETFADRLRRVSEGKTASIVGVETDEQNATFLAERRDWALDRSLVQLEDGMEHALAAIALTSDALLTTPLQMPWGMVAPLTWVESGARHDREHSAQLNFWHKALRPQDAVGPQQLLLSALRASRRELLRLVALTPTTERDSLLVCGDWTTKDVLGHVTDWEAVSLTAARHLVDPSAPLLAYNGDLDAYNSRSQAVRRSQPWDFVWAESQAVHLDLMALLDELTPERLARATSTRWSATDSPYQWISAVFAHDREHSISLAAYWSVPRLV